LILLLSALEFVEQKKIEMKKLIIDAADKKIFLVIINKDNIYSISHENSKTNYEKLMILINEFLKSKNIEFNDIVKVYVNRGPGSFASIRNSLAITKAIFVTKKIDYYSFSYDDFGNEKNVKYENIPNLCDKFGIKKNLINPIYIS
jgi:tRNA threonylcarbamoyladenosine biosynthesis protein TsaB